MDQMTEMDKLRQRVAELEGELASAPGARPAREDRPGRWRALVSVVLIVIGCLMAPFAVGAVWANRQVSDTDRYVKTVTPLASDPAVQAAVASQVSAAVLDALDVPARTSEVIDGLSAQGLSPAAVQGLQALEVPLNRGIEQFVRSSVSKVVASEQFATLWVEANRAAHASLVHLLSGEQGTAVTAQGDQVTLNLGPIIAEVKQRLIDQGYSVAEKIPPIDRSFVLMQSDQVTKAQGVYRLLDKLGFWLPILALLFIGAGVSVARDHRRALIGGALGLVVGMLALGVGLAIGRIFYLDSVPTDVMPRNTAADVFDTLVRFLRTSLRAVAVLALVVAAGAFFTGPAPSAVRTRAWFGRSLGSFRSGAESHGIQTGAFGRWTYDHRRVLWIGLAVLAGFTLTFWQQPTAGIVIWTAVVLVLLMGLVELLSRPPTAVAGHGVPAAPEARVPQQGGASEDADTASATKPGTTSANTTGPSMPTTSGTASGAGPRP